MSTTPAAVEHVVGLMPPADRYSVRFRVRKAADRGWTHIGVWEGADELPDGGIRLREPAPDDLYGCAPGEAYCRPVP